MSDQRSDPAATLSADLPANMKAVLLTGHGGFEKLEYRTDVSVPKPGSGEVLIGLKVSKNGGLTGGRRRRDICLAAGYTVSVQDTTGSDIVFATIVRLGQTVPERNLRRVLECRDMVSLKTADGPFEVVNGLVRAPTLPGLGITSRLDALGTPVATYS